MSRKVKVAIVQAAPIPFAIGHAITSLVEMVADAAAVAA